MKANFRLMAVTLTLLSASLAGCLGGDDTSSDEYSGPINLVVFYDSTSGMIETSVNNGQQGPTTGVELSFDFADSTSEDGSITKIMLDPDDGSNPVEGDPSDNAVLSYTWMTHGVFEVTLTAEDDEGNSHSIEVKVRIDMHIVWTDSNTNSASMFFDTTSDCTDGIPYPDRVTFTSTATDTGALFSGGADVEWTFNDPEGAEVASDSGSMGNGQAQTWDYTSRDIVPGNYEIKLEVTQGDNVNVENDVTIAYLEGVEDPVNPRTE